MSTHVICTPELRFESHKVALKSCVVVIKQPPIVDISPTGQRSTRPGLKEWKGAIQFDADGMYTFMQAMGFEPSTAVVLTSAAGDIGIVYLREVRLIEGLACLMGTGKPINLPDAEPESI